MKNFFLISFLVLTSFLKSQTIDYVSIKKIIAETYPEIDFTNKLLALSVWNSSDVISRTNNKEFLRTYKVYKDARLLGGLKGVVFISINSDNNEMNFNIAEKKDSLIHSYIIKDFKAYLPESKLTRMKFDKKIQNLVFDTNGKLIYQNLETSLIFKSFNNLITR